MDSNLRTHHVDKLGSCGGVRDQHGDHLHHQGVRQPEIPTQAEDTHPHRTHCGVWLTYCLLFPLFTTLSLSSKYLLFICVYVECR